MNASNQQRKPHQAPTPVRRTGAHRALVPALGIPFFEGNQIDILKNGREIFPAMLDSIDRATRTVDFLTFVYWRGDVAERFARALANAARRGVRVRVLLDAVGAFPMDGTLVSSMEEAGADVRWFRPVSRWTVFWNLTHRTHRKVLVCDRREAFTGGVGIGEEWEGDARHPGEWRETHFRIRGPAVQGLEGAFLGNWLEVAEDDVEDDPFDWPEEPVGDSAIQVVRSGASVSWTDMATLLRVLIHRSRSSILLCTPYFVPDSTTIDLLKAAVERGVDVRVLVPGPHMDHRVAQAAGEGTYATLLGAGVQIWEYQKTMIHQKIGLFDSNLVTIGSGNLNHRSLLQDDEVQLVVDDTEFAAHIETMLDEDLRDAVPITVGEWRRRGRVQRAFEAIMRPFRRQM